MRAITGTRILPRIFSRSINCIYRTLLRTQVPSLRNRQSGSRCPARSLSAESTRMFTVGQGFGPAADLPVGADQIHDLRDDQPACVPLILPCDQAGRATTASSTKSLRENTFLYCARFQVLDARRRNFLIRTCQGALAVLGRLRAQTVPLVDAAFHLHPQYRSATPLDATLLKVEAGSDDFITEKYQDRIAAILGGWS